MEQETENIIKQFVEWIKIKTKIHLCKPADIYFNEREIWWARLGLNVGFEVKGKGENFSRPIIILKKLSSDTCLIIPLTTSSKRKNLFPLGKINGDEDSFALLEQIRLIDKKRLEEKVGMLEENLFNDFKGEVLALIGETNKSG
jgi:mRNA interferase MazF